MTLHMLYRTNRLKDCLALTTATDTLLVMEPSVLESIKDHIPAMPCPVLLLCDGASKDHSTASDIRQIDVDEWVRLVADRPHSMVWDQPAVDAAALDTLCDSNGFLADYTAWTPEIAHGFAVLEGITLTETHWEILQSLRAFFEDYGDSPANRALVNYVKHHLGPDKGNSLYLMRLFPGSPARVGSRIAGLPKPKNCL